MYVYTYILTCTCTCIIYMETHTQSYTYIYVVISPIHMFTLNMYMEVCVPCIYVVCVLTCMRVCINGMCQGDAPALSLFNCFYDVVICMTLTQHSPCGHHRGRGQPPNTWSAVNTDVADHYHYQNQLVPHQNALYDLYPPVAIITTYNYCLQAKEGLEQLLHTCNIHCYQPFSSLSFSVEKTFDA